LSVACDLPHTATYVLQFMFNVEITSHIRIIFRRHNTDESVKWRLFKTISLH